MSTSKGKNSLNWLDVMQNNYGEPKITLASGKGVIVTDTSGKKYLDFIGGIATNVLGHAHPVIVRAVSKQIATLGHVSNLYSHPSGLALASKLRELTGDQHARVFSAILELKQMKQLSNFLVKLAAARSLLQPVLSMDAPWALCHSQASQVNATPLNR